MRPIPEQRAKVPTQPIEIRTKAVAKALMALKWMPKYPAEEASFKFYCRALAGFMQTEDRRNWFDADLEWSQKHGLGWVNPLAWTVQQVGETCQFFPAPIKWREVYCSRFGPLDGKYPTDLYEVVED